MESTHLSSQTFQVPTWAVPVPWRQQCAWSSVNPLVAVDYQPHVLFVSSYLFTSFHIIECIHLIDCSLRKRSFFGLAAIKTGKRPLLIGLTPSHCELLRCGATPLVSKKEMKTTWHKLHSWIWWNWQSLKIFKVCWKLAQVTWFKTSGRASSELGKKLQQLIAYSPYIPVQVQLTSIIDL